MTDIREQFLARRRKCLRRIASGDRAGFASLDALIVEMRHVLDASDPDRLETELQYSLANARGRHGSWLVTTPAEVAAVERAFGQGSDQAITARLLALLDDVRLGPQAAWFTPEQADELAAKRAELLARLRPTMQSTISNYIRLIGGESLAMAYGRAATETLEAILQDDHDAAWAGLDSIMDDDEDEACADLVELLAAMLPERAYEAPSDPEDGTESVGSFDIYIIKKGKAYSVKDGLPFDI